MQHGAWSLAATVLHVLVATGCVLHVLRSRKRPAATILWILTVTYLPWIGPLLYLGFGVNRIRRRIEHRQENRRLLFPRIRELPHPEHEPVGETAHPSFTGACPEVFQEFFRLLDRLTGVSASSGNRCTLMRGGEEVFGAMGEAVAGATHSVHMLTYILDDDEVGRPLLEQLAERASQGLAVRVLVDGYGSNMLPLSRVRAYRRQGVDLRISRQFQPLRGRITVNLRNHRKLLIVDGAQVFTGGMNISARHLLSRPETGHVLDFHTRVEGPATLQLQRVFAEDWFDVTGEDIVDPAYFSQVEPAGTDVVRCLDSGPDRSTRVMLWAFCAAIQTAGRSIRIVTPYFVPDPAIVILLQLAAMGGVDTRIVLPRANNFRTVKYASRYLYPELMRSGVRIFERDPPFSHAKLLLVDDTWASVGSANWDMRTFHLQFDANIGVVSPAFVGQVAEAIEGELAASREVTLENFLPRPTVRGMLEKAASLFGDML